jgi:hypothetical protein
VIFKYAGGFASGFCMAAYNITDHGPWQGSRSMAHCVAAGMLVLFGVHSHRPKPDLEP